MDHAGKYIIFRFKFQDIYQITFNIDYILTTVFMFPVYYIQGDHVREPGDRGAGKQDKTNF